MAADRGAWWPSYPRLRGQEICSSTRDDKWGLCLSENPSVLLWRLLLNSTSGVTPPLRETMPEPVADTFM